ncbi:MAG: hypothetical protein UT01_C0058G0010 [Candidatus Daviesbacteria bacterium GW2011_GWA1_38_7]|nr:MAG: hypothetical protein UT01_C0058G0010 [Candidatus Daviesbacteria bacterium GW2011_GWA1_38_7]
MARIDNRIATESALTKRPEKAKWKHLHEEEVPLRRLSEQYEDALMHVQALAGSRTQIVKIDTDQFKTDEVAELVLNKVQSVLIKLRSSSPV